MKKIEIKEGQLGIFQADCGFTIKVSGGIACVEPDSHCLNYNNDPSGKRYEHDCEHCWYLGNFSGYDGYYCEIGDITVIARYGEGNKYLSGLGFSGILKEIESYARYIKLL